MDQIALGLLPIISILCAISVLLVDKLIKRAIITYLTALIYIAILVYLNTAILASVLSNGFAYYRFGGFPPPLGVLYVADIVSSSISLVSTVILLLSLLYTISLEHDPRRPYLIALMMLTATGTYGCLFTWDIFHLYVSIELVAIASYAIVAYYRDREDAVAASFIYGLYGTIMTSILLLGIILLYSVYGTLSYTELSIKASDPSVVLPLSNGVYGDIVLNTKISLALIIWVFIFKSGIVPSHFWLPRVYRNAPLVSIAYLSASSDLVGVYGIYRLFNSVFHANTLISDYRENIMLLLLIIGSISSIIASLNVARQKTIRGIIAYSSITQYSLALIGFASGTLPGIIGSSVHLMVNSLGDSLVIFSVISSRCPSRRGLGFLHRTLTRIGLLVGFLNLFGVIPVLPGFWSKALITMGLVEARFYPGIVAVLASSGLCAIGYFNYFLKFIGIPTYSSRLLCIERVVSDKIATLVALTTVILIIALGVHLAYLVILHYHGLTALYGSPVDISELIRITIR